MKEEPEELKVWKRSPFKALKEEEKEEEKKNANG